MKKHWVLVANSSYAMILEVKGLGKEIHLLQKIDFPDGRKRDRDINTDKPGRAFASTGAVRHAVGSSVDPHQHEQEIFAHQLSKLLHKAKSEQQFDDLSIIAPAHFLGELKAVLTDQVKHAIAKEVSKDLPATLSNEQRDEHVAKYLDLWNR